MDRPYFRLHVINRIHKASKTPLKELCHQGDVEALQEAEVTLAKHLLRYEQVWGVKYVPQTYEKLSEGSDPKLYQPYSDKLLAIPRPTIQKENCNSAPELPWDA